MRCQDGACNGGAPGDAITGALVHRFGAIDTLRLIDSDAPIPGEGRANADLWRNNVLTAVDSVAQDGVFAETD